MKGSFARWAPVAIGVGLLMAACGATSSTRSEFTATPSPTLAPLTTDQVQTVIHKMFPSASPTGECGSGSYPCPFTSRLRNQLQHLETQTPNPSGHGDICNYSLISGTQNGADTPVVASVVLTGAAAASAIVRQANKTLLVTLDVVTVQSDPLVDNITYPSGQSIYDLDCSGVAGINSSS
jgi:hypothetical protein